MATHRLSSIAILAAFMLLVSGADDVVLGQAPSSPKKPSELLKEQREKEARERPARPRVAPGPVCGPASAVPPRLLAASDSAGLKAASCMPVVVTGTVARVDRQPSRPHSAVIMTRIYFVEASDVFVHVDPELDDAVAARLGTKELGFSPLRGQKIAVHINPLLVQPTGPIKLSIARAEDLSLSGQPAPAAAVVTSDDFLAEGLTNRDLLTGLFAGKFKAIELDPNSQIFLMLFNAYLVSYARLCTPYLPPKKVEITSQECASERVTRNGFGTVVARTCVEYVAVGIGLFADPVLYDARVSIDNRLAADPFHGGGGLLTMVAFKEVINEDMSALVKMNGCNSPGLKRFQENLRLFALNRQPIRLGGGSAPSAVNTAAIFRGPYRDQNYARLMEDLVSDQASQWSLNHYISGSVTGVTVTSRDDRGRPARMSAHYKFDGFKGRIDGSVNVTFFDGLPDCIYFFDTPAACKTPDRHIVSSYAEGAYER